MSKNKAILYVITQGIGYIFIPCILILVLGRIIGANEIIPTLYSFSVIGSFVVSILVTVYLGVIVLQNK